LIDLAGLPPNWQWIIALWLAVVGGCVGSFLNVVVYRLPAGKNLAWPGSFCPKCGHAIRWYDNVPVLGWIALGGRCRDCREPISLRYPLVEAITAAMFFGLAWIELLNGGANFPGREIAITPKQVISRDYTTHELVGFYSLHLLLLCTLLAAALVDHDRRKMPVQLFAPAFLVAILALLFCPYLYPGRIDLWYSGPLWKLIPLIVFIVAGLAVGRAIGWLVPRRDANLMQSTVPPQSTRQDSIVAFWQARNLAADGILWSMLCVILYLGPLAVLVLGTAVALLAVANHAARRIYFRCGLVSPVIWLVALVPAYIAFERPLASAIREITMR